MADMLVAKEPPGGLTCKRPETECHRANPTSSANGCEQGGRGMRSGKGGGGGGGKKEKKTAGE